MLAIVGPVAPAVKPAPIVATSYALRGFERWAAAQLAPAEFIAGRDKLPLAAPVPTEAEVALADRLAFDADGGDLDEYRPEWRGDSYQATRRQEVEDIGQRIGLEGGWPTFEEVFPECSVRDSLLYSLEFSEGLHTGHKMRARRLGFQVAVDGGPCALPASVPSRFQLDFECGWDEGEVEREWREAELADFFAKCDVEHDMWLEEQENRSRMGWPVPAAWCPSTVD